MIRSAAAAGVLALTFLWAPGGAYANQATPDFIRAAIADPARPADQVARDGNRKPAAVIAFSGLKPGDRVGDFMSGNAYFTRIFSRVVGDTGHVYAFVPDEELKNCDSSETAGTLALAHDAAYSNVTVLKGPVNSFHAPEALDLVWTSLNFHDLYDSFMGPADVPAVTKALFASLKPGGVFLVIDHAAEAGSQIRDTGTLHRIDPEVIIREAQAAGFKLEAQSDALRNPNDTHKLRVFDAAIRGRTDQVVLKFRKPVS